METSVLQRIRELIDYYSLSDRKFAESIGLPQTTISSLFQRGNEPNVSIVQAILNRYTEISPDWLLTGNSSTFIDPTKRKKDITKEQTRPRIPYTASAGSLTSAVDGVTEAECEQIPVITAFPSYDFTMFVKGDSMYPNYEGGDEVACKRIDSTSFIQWGKVHVLDTAQGIVIKRVYDDDGNVKCVSYNKEYPDFTISKEEVYSMSLVVGMIRL